MATISLSLPSDGQTIDAADVNTPLNIIAAVINGNLDDNNIASGANINGTKLLANSVPPTSYDVNARAGWNAGIVTVMPTVTALGNRSYSLVHASTDLTGYLSPGMRLKLTRTVAAPTQSTSLNGTTQFWSKASPAGMTFTNNFVVSAWVKLTSYAAGTIVSRTDGTSGYIWDIQASGQVRLTGYNAGFANFSYVQSYQSIPLNKWVHIAAQLDMLTFTSTPTTSYVMLDGLDVPTTSTRGGTNPTALVQAGNLNIGSYNGGAGEFFPGKIAQVAIYSAKVTQATILASMHQTLTGSETSLISAYSFNNSFNDLNANANNLTANGSAVATNADSPYAQAATAGSLEYGIITAASFSTNTTLTVQVPEGSAIPTSGGVSALSYSTQAVPYGFPKQKDKWRIINIVKTDDFQTSPVSNTWYNPSPTTSVSGGNRITIPIGEWNYGYEAVAYSSTATISTAMSCDTTLSTGASSATDPDLTGRIYMAGGSAITGTITGNVKLEKGLSISTATTYFLNVRTSVSSVSDLHLNPNSVGSTKIYADNAYL